jgi:hypothetical protein
MSAALNILVQKKKNLKARRAPWNANAIDNKAVNK